MNNKKTAQVYHFDLYGTRDNKYEFLHNNSLKSVNWNELKNEAPNYHFVKKDIVSLEFYSEGFSISDIFNIYSSNYQTEKDDLAVKFTEIEISDIISDFKNLSYQEILIKYKLTDTISTKNAFADLNANKAVIVEYDYKILDKRFTLFTGKTNGFIGRPRSEISKNVINKDNISLLAMRSLVDTEKYNTIFLSKTLADKNYYGFQTYFYPLYLYPEKDSKTASRTPNLNSEIVQKIASDLGLKFTNEKEADSGTFAPIDILDYIYVVLHSPTYREKYKEFLKIDFPRVPYPKDKETFWKLVRLGGELRQIHLLESHAVEKYITKYPADGDNVVNKIKYQDGKVYINDTQHFEGVPEVAWNFYIGGYQPAQKWLKDRKGRKLEFDDILHYQKIIVALTETDRIMKEVDKVEVE